MSNNKMMPLLRTIIFQSILPVEVDDGVNLNQSLLEASKEGDQLGVDILLKLRADVNYKNEGSKTDSL
jgi:hypothetical protein